MFQKFLIIKSINERRLFNSSPKLNELTPNSLIHPHFFNAIKVLTIIHIHGNNFLPTIKNIPQALEISFINTAFINKKLKNYRSYPIADLDFPNNIIKKDIKLFFKK